MYDHKMLIISIILLIVLIFLIFCVANFLVKFIIKIYKSKYMKSIGFHIVKLNMTNDGLGCRLYHRTHDDIFVPESDLFELSLKEIKQMFKSLEE